MIGISLSPGMGHSGSRGGRFSRAGSAASTFEYRKLVRPVTSTFSTTPTMTWSTRYLIANAASTNDTSTPATRAASRPTTQLPVRVAVIAETKAPASSWPSMATLTTPPRSEMTPPRAPNTSGTDRLIVPNSRPVTGTGSSPEPAKARNPNMNSSAYTITSQIGVLRTFQDSQALYAVIRTS